jgi:hypothetical protein
LPLSLKASPCTALPLSKTTIVVLADCLFLIFGGLWEDGPITETQVCLPLPSFQNILLFKTFLTKKLLLRNI